MSRIVKVVTHAPHLGPKPMPTSPPRESPPVLTKAQRLTRELISWVRKGAPLASREQRNARLAICRECSYYLATGNRGFGECGAPGCGCTRAKTWLLTSKCPHPDGPRWD